MATTMHQPWPPAFADYLTRKHYWLHPSRMGGEAHLKVELDASTGFPGAGFGAMGAREGSYGRHARFDTIHRSLP